MTKQPYFHHSQAKQPFRTRYMLGKVLSQGGFGTVITATPHSRAALKCPQYVAIKCVVLDRDDAYQDSWFKEVSTMPLCVKDDFMQECRVQYTLSRKHGIGPRVYEYGVEDGMGFLVMNQWSRALTLGDCLSATLVQQLKHTLHRMHEAGYVHLDLRPDNILVRVDPKTQCITAVTLGDFGLAIAYKEVSPHSSEPLTPTTQDYLLIMKKLYGKRNWVKMDWDMFEENVLQWINEQPQLK